MIDPRVIEPIAARGWPAAHSDWLGGWRLHASDGQSGRINTCWALEPPARDVEAAIDAVEAWYAAHRKASEVAKATSDPPRGVSIQAFGIFSKIREIDTLLIARPGLRDRVFESHPEVAFCRLNGDRAMSLPKKIKGSVNPAGMAERKALLCRHGYAMGFLDQPPPRGAAADDFLDAAVMMLIAGRIANGKARPFPDPPRADGFGIPVAIWA